MAAVEPDQAALDALVRARLAEEAGNPAEALAALQSLASQAPDLPGLRAEMLERAIDAGDLIAARNAAAALWASGDQRFDARLVLVVDAMRRSDWKGARAYLGTAQDDKSGGDAISRLIDPALGAWVDAGQRARQPERALVAAATRGRPEPAYALEAALVQLAAGQSDAAVAAALETTPTDRLSQLVALRLVASLDAARQKDAAGTLRSRIALAAGEREDPLLLLPEQAVTNPRAGAGHWLALVADTLARLPKSNARLPLTFARAATWLNDQDWTARSALADALARSDRAADGAAFLGGLRGPLPPVLRMRLAELTAEEGDRAAAVKIAEEAVTGDTPRSLLVRFADLARQSDDAAAAERAYTRLEAALGDGDDSAPLRATLLVARAELRLQAKDWDGAAPLMQRALALRPNDPTILNFVGYSALERRIDVAFEGAEAALPDERAGRFFFEQPEAIANQRPHAGIAHHAGPGLLARRGLAGDEARRARIGPHGGAGVQIRGAMAAQDEALGFEHGRQINVRQAPPPSIARPARWTNRRRQRGAQPHGPGRRR